MYIQRLNFSYFACIYLLFRLVTKSSVNPKCADDVSLIADSEKNLQILIDTVVNYSKQENYKLQPAKSAVMSFNTNMENPGYNYTINNESIQKPDTIVHLGITHHRNYRKTTSTQIQQNMEKSRRTLYSLLGAGLHGKNGLNPTACLHLLQVFIIPILTYGLEILLPSRTELQTLEIFYRKILKQILSIPTHTADPAVYILAGVIPIESRIHKLALGMYADICRTSNSIEREITERQLGMKAINDNSWFSNLKQILAIYELPSSHNILDLPPTKNAWKKMINKAVNEYWIDHIKKMSTYFKSLDYLNASNYSNGKAHAALASVQPSARDIARLHVKLRLMTGTYYLQSNKAAFNQSRIDPTCLVCQMESEILEHFLLDCNVPAESREPYISELNVLIKECHPCVKCNTTNTFILNLRSILDPSTVCCGCGCDCNCLKTLYTFEHVIRRVCFALNTKRNNILKTLPNTRRKGL